MSYYYLSGMSNELAIQSNIAPASFCDVIIDRDRFNGVHMISLIKDKISSRQPITRDDIVECYIKTCSKDGLTIRIRQGLGWPNRQVTVVYGDKSHPIIRQRALGWFKNNLGSAIIKGKLLVIPIIDIE